jgi:hypothetical protein
MKKRASLILLVIFSIFFINLVSASTSYQVLETKTMKIGDTWSIAVSSYNLKFISIQDSKHAVFTLTKGTSSSTITLAVGATPYKYGSPAYFLNLTSIASNANFVTIASLKSVCTQSWSCSNWTKCTTGVNSVTRTCTDLNNCGNNTGKPSTSMACLTLPCTPSWSCTDWSQCVNNQQTRTCTDTKNCGKDTGKPNETQSCDSGLRPVDEQCDEDWACSDWSDCVNNRFTRVCTDLNDCGTQNNRPSGSMACSNEPNEPNDCVESWQCSQWTACVNNQQLRTCIDRNACGTVVNRPATTYSCNPANTGVQDGSLPSNSGSGSHNVVINNSNTPGSAKNFTINETDILADYNKNNPMNIPFFFFFLIPFLIILLLLYIYISCAFTSIGKKAKINHYGIAWIPVVGPLLISSKAAKMHWWPILLLGVYAILETVSLLTFVLPIPIFVTYLFNFINGLLLLTVTIFSFIWIWKTFTLLGKPGWWVLFNIIPILGTIVFLILLGVVAWSDSEVVVANQIRKVSRKKKKNKKNK